MGDNSLIQWTDATWNPVTGCTKVSAGCARCYIERTVPFRTQGRRFAGPNGPDQPGATTEVVLHPERLDQPLRWLRPRRVFVNSLSDLFHPEVPDGFIASVFAVMTAAGRHTFQVLTKRPGRMRSLLSQPAFRRLVAGYVDELLADLPYGYRTQPAFRRMVADNWPGPRHPDGVAMPWPLPNVWLGTSVEDQRAAELRIPKLLATPAAIRFLSCEPLLGPVELRPEWLELELRAFGGNGIQCFPRVDWLIVGGESGPGARVMELAWARSLLAQGRAFGVAVFVKQLGRAWSLAAGLGAGHGGDPQHWPPDLRVRELPDRAHGEVPGW